MPKPPSSPLCSPATLPRWFGARITAPASGWLKFTICPEQLGTKKSREDIQSSRLLNYTALFLEREVNAGAGHSEVVVGARNDVPADVVGPADVRGEANFKTATDLADHLRVALVEVSADDAERSRVIEEEVVITTAT